MDPLGALHLGTAFLAIASGAAVLSLSPKGGRSHRRLGWVYVGSMLALNTSALMIYRLFGGFGPFHYFAVFSLLGLLLGVGSAIGARKRREARDRKGRAVRVERHYYWMTFSYAGLIAAFASEAITRLPATRPAGGPGLSFALAVGGATAVIMVIATRWIKGSARTSLARVGAERGQTPRDPLDG